MLYLTLAVLPCGRPVLRVVPRLPGASQLVIAEGHSANELWAQAASKIANGVQEDNGRTTMQMALNKYVPRGGSAATLAGLVGQ